MRYYLAIFATICFYSTVEVVSVHIRGVDPNFLAFIRFLPPGLIFLCLSARRFLRVTLIDFLALAGLGVIGVTGTFWAYHHSLGPLGLDASIGAVIFSVNPVFCAVAGHFVLRESLSWLRLAGVALGFVGVFIVSFGFKVPTLESMEAPLLMFGAQICFAFYVTAGKRYVARYGPLFVNGVIFTVGSLLFLPMIGEWGPVSSAQTAAWLAYLSVLATGLAYYLYFYGLNHVPIAAGTSVFYLKPVLASVLAMVVLNERLEQNFYIGLGVILVSLVLVIFRVRRQAR